MNNTEANKAARLIRWITGRPTVTGDPITADQARDAATYLVGRAHATLGAGLTPEQVAASWPDTDPAHDRARISILEDAVLASAELLLGQVPTTPPGLADWYTQNLHELVVEIKGHRGESRRG